MAAQAMTRRGFAGLFGTALGASVLAPPLSSAAEPAARSGSAGGIIQLSSNENPDGPSPKAAAAAVRAMADACRYPDAVAGRLVDAVAAHHGVSRDQVVLGCGSSQILHMADLAYVSPDRALVAAEPTFEAVLEYAGVIGASRRLVPLSADHRHDLEKMTDACDEKTGLVYICNPNNPTGTIVSGDALAAFVAKLPPTTVVLVDEAYHHFVEDPSYRTSIDLIATRPNVVVARTFSKIYGLAGMRLGYAVGNAATIAALRKRASWDNVNVAVLAAGLASLSDAGLVPARRKTLNATRRWLSGELSKDGRRIIPSEANFVMIDVDRDVRGVIEAFRQRRILVGRKFPSMPNWLRITIGKRSEMEAFLAELRRIVPARAAAA